MLVFSDVDGFLDEYFLIDDGDLIDATLSEFILCLHDQRVIIFLFPSTDMAFVG